MARLSQVFAPRDREFFDLFEEAGAQHPARRRAARPDAAQLPGARRSWRARS